MKNFKLILGLNFLIMIIYTCLISKAIPYTGVSDKDIELGRLGVEAVVVVFQVIINLILVFFFKHIGEKETSKSFFVIAGIILVIGYSSCFALTR